MRVHASARALTHARARAHTHTHTHKNNVATCFEQPWNMVSLGFLITKPTHVTVNKTHILLAQNEQC